MKVVVSIINYRTGDLTIQAVQSVLSDMTDIRGHVVIVDNLSGDGSAEQIETWIASQDPSVPVTLVQSKTNSGFSGGHNQGMQALKAEYYLVLNSDAVLRPGFFEIILAAAEENPQAGLIAPRLEDEDETPQVSCFRFPSPASELIRGAASGPVTRLLARYNMWLAGIPDAKDIGWASFACILLRGDMTTALGPMDEGYFLYFEDTEYCWRARQAGWSIKYLPKARAVHFRGGSAPVKTLAKAKKRLPAYFYASRTRLFYQCYGWGGLILANICWHLGRLIANIRGLVGKPAPPASAAEWRDTWINVFRPLGPGYATKD